MKKNLGTREEICPALGHCMLPVPQSHLPTGLTGRAGPRICAGLGADATSPGSHREPQESAEGEI